MSKRQKLIQQWRESPPAEEEYEKIKAILEHFGFTFRTLGKHPVATHPDLADSPLMMRGITIPTVSGRKVKGFYLRRIVDALEQIGAYEDE